MSVAATSSPHQLAAWQHADDLAQLVYRLTWKFMQADPGLVQRMRTAAITVAASMLAAQRGGRWQARRTLLTASVALAELDYYTHFARRAGLIGDVDLRKIQGLQEQVNRHFDPLPTGRSTEGG